eukprot:2654838-Prymnesium_polylepis.1
MVIAWSRSRDEDGAHGAVVDPLLLAERAVFSSRSSRAICVLAAVSADAVVSLSCTSISLSQPLSSRSRAICASASSSGHVPSI